MDTLPTWLAVVMILVSGPSALYHCYIKPGYESDKDDYCA